VGDRDGEENNANGRPARAEISSIEVRPAMINF
jgi:hypothetical protein